MGVLMKVIILIMERLEKVMWDIINLIIKEQQLEWQLRI